MNKSFPVSLLSLALSSLASAQATLPEVNVTADFRQASVTDIPASISVIDEQLVQQRAAAHLEELLNIAPNVNFSSGASRARFYQIRGIGERSQFIEPINPSVGLIIDDIDYTGIGTAGTTLDIQQVEILRGPQGTRYGANALAGLINMKSRDPGETVSGELNVSYAEYDTWTTSAAVGGPINDTLGYRVALSQTQSDGFIDNDFLNKDDTNDIDELTFRGKLVWQVNDDLRLDVNAAHFDIDNGYDAFSLDNTRHTLSDQPGHDRQETDAVGVKASWDGNTRYRVEVLASATDSETEYGYDEDWAYDALCDGLSCEGWTYSSFDNYLRDRDSRSAELRVISSDEGRLFADTTNWIFGFYHQSLREDLHRTYTYLADDFFSDYDVDRVSGFFELQTQLSERWLLTTGYRLEQHEIRYRDSNAVAFNHDEDLWGGKIALEYLLSEDAMVYALVSRGYKSGGVNSRTELPESVRTFDTETMLNYELGYKASYLDGRLNTSVAFFLQSRDDVQVKQSLVLPIEGDICPCQFIDHIGNAAEGENYGLEAELQWQVNNIWKLHGSVGLLETEFQDFVNADGTNLEGREQAHAPSYQFFLASTLNLSETLSFVLEMEGKDEFYFSDRHEEQSDRYELINARLQFTQNNWHLALWGKNLTDEEYQVRGFGSFGNDPRKFYETEPYYQYGAPRVVGVSAGLRF